MEGYWCEDGIVLGIEGGGHEFLQFFRHGTKNPFSFVKL